MNLTYNLYLVLIVKAKVNYVRNAEKLANGNLVKFYYMLDGAVQLPINIVPFITVQDVGEWWILSLCVPTTSKQGT